MNNNNAKIIIRFLLLIPLQVLLANNIRFLGWLNPQLCLLFVIWYPLKKDNLNFVINSFLFGLIIDLFSNSGGINAAAFTLIAYVKLPVLKFILNDKDLELKLFKYSNYGNISKITFIFSLAFIHQLTINSLEYFNVTHTLTILYKSFVSSLFTTFVSILFLTIFSPSKS